MTVDAITALAGVVLSLVFAYLPWLKDWFDALDPRYKPLVMAGLLFAVTVGKFVIDCDFQGACLAAGWQGAVTTFFAALVANQTTYQFAVKQVKRAEYDDLLEQG